MLCDVHSTPPEPSSADLRILARTSCAVAGSSEAVGSSSSSSSGRFSIAFARPTRVCSPEESTPHFVLRNGSRSNSFEQRFDALEQVFHAIDQAEDAQVVIDGQIAGQRSVNGGEVGVLQRLRTGACARSSPSI